MKRSVGLFLSLIVLCSFVFTSCKKEIPKPGKAVIFSEVCTEKYKPKMEKGALCGASCVS